MESNSLCCVLHWQQQLLCVRSSLGTLLFTLSELRTGLTVSHSNCSCVQQSEGGFCLF